MSVGQAFQRGFLRVHDAVYRGTRGIVGHRLAGGAPSLLLRTTGRRSGRERTSALIYARDGDDFVVVGSNHGFDRPPGWLLNLLARPEVGVQVARRRAEARARVVEPDDPDYPKLWKLVNENNRHRYEGYQQRTSRAIPIAVITPSAPLR